jgi:CheY-like chemotaxis protein
MQDPQKIVPPTYPYTVLLADDDADDQYFLETAFREIDPQITLTIAVDGLQAINYFLRTGTIPFTFPKFIITFFPKSLKLL